MEKYDINNLVEYVSNYIRENFGKNPLPDITQDFDVQYRNLWYNTKDSIQYQGVTFKDKTALVPVWQAALTTLGEMRAKSHATDKHEQAEKIIKKLFHNVRMEMALDPKTYHSNMPVATNKLKDCCLEAQNTLLKRIHSEDLAARKTMMELIEKNDKLAVGTKGVIDALRRRYPQR